MANEAAETPTTPPVDVLSELNRAADAEWKLDGAIRALMMATSADHLDDRDRHALAVIHDTIADTWRGMAEHLEAAREALAEERGRVRAEQAAERERMRSDPADALKSVHFAAEAVARMLDDARAKAEALSRATAPVGSELRA